MSDREPPPLEDAARALIERSKRMDPPPAPTAARARVMAGVETALGQRSAGRDPGEASASIASPDEPLPGRVPERNEDARRTGRARSWRVRLLLAAAALPALIALGPPLRARLFGTIGSDREPISATPCGGTGSIETDPHNCGRCGHDCCGGTCESGVCQPFVIAQGYHPGVAAVDSSYVYWPDGSDSLGRIMKAPKAGGEATVIASNQRRPWAVAVDAQYAYWVTNRDDTPDYGGVYKVPLEGGEVIPLVRTGEPFAGDIAVDDAGVYWDDYGAYPPGARNLLDCAPGAAIRHAALDGANPTTLAGTDAGVCTPLLLGLDDGAIYWASRARGIVQSIPRTGGGVTEVAKAGDPMAVAVDPSYVYWVSWQDGLVERAPREGGEPVTLASSGRDAGPNSGVGAVDIAVDAANVYWARQGPPWGAGGAILSAPTSGVGGDIGAVIATSPNPVNLTLDRACVYWVDGSDGKIRSVAKP